MFLNVLELCTNPDKTSNACILQGYLFVESFAGSGAATKAVRSMYPEARTAAFDIKYSQSMDVTSEGGMALLACT